MLMTNAAKSRQVCCEVFGGKQMQKRLTIGKKEISSGISNQHWSPGTDLRVKHKFQFSWCIVQAVAKPKSVLVSDLVHAAVFLHP